MEERLYEDHKLDDQGRPAGGFTHGVGITINWQAGPLGRGEGRRSPTGAFVEGVIQAAVGRLQFYQASPFKCRENALAITHLQEGLHWLQHRTAQREARGVEGSHEP